MKVELRENFKEFTDARPRLTIGKEYDVIGIEADYYRLMDEDGEPVLFPPQWFVVVDAAEPDDWVQSLGEEGERYAYPPELDRVGFFEDWHDRDPEAMRTLDEYLQRKRKAQDKDNSAPRGGPA